ncbi:hypothetical protein MLD38_028876 [Melastoma candidum]|uniref:Uncharacterized protein n=1 Tax=Melastoma candidum TaxID=119954 RepID=A0ACB9N6J6_9MYRT|nr:hypothetical protein MLD38_028876 [Melastoma candidum]
MEGQDSDSVEDMNNHTTPSDDILNLPPGFRFHPTDEEVVTHYLTPKLLNLEFAAAAIAEVDLNKCEPWDMPGRAKIGEKDWVFNKSTGGIINNSGNNYVQSCHPPTTDWTGFTTSFIDELLEDSSPSPPPLVDPSSIAGRVYSSKWDGTDLVEGNRPDNSGCFLISSNGLLPRQPVQNCNPFGNSDYSLQGLMGEHPPRPGMPEQYKGNWNSSADPSLTTLCRDAAEFEGGEGTSTDPNNETSSAMTTVNGSVTVRSSEAGYYGYIESSLMDAADDYDLALESLMNQENPIL